MADQSTGHASCARAPRRRTFTTYSEGVARLYASTGDGIARLDESNGAWKVTPSLRGSGAQCVAVDPRDADVAYAGLRESGVRRTSDGGRTWVDCGLPAPGVFSVAVSAVDGAVYAGTEPSALFRSDDGGGTWHELSALRHPRAPLH